MILSLKERALWVRSFDLEMNQSKDTTSTDNESSRPDNTAKVFIAGVVTTLQAEGMDSNASLGKLRSSFLSPDSDCVPDIDFSLDIHQRPLKGRLPPEYAKATWLFENHGEAVSVKKWTLEGEQILEVVSNDFMAHASGIIDPRFVKTTCGCIGHAWFRQLGLGLIPLAIRLARHGGLIFHGSALRLNGTDGVLCIGQSGRGKSTISRLAEEAGETPFCDERPIVRLHSNGAFRLHGSPWFSSGHYSRNISAPLRRIYFLEHGEQDEIIPLRPSESLLRMRMVAIIPWQVPAFFDPILNTLEALVTSIPCAVLRFRPTTAAIDCIRRDIGNPNH